MDEHPTWIQIDDDRWESAEKDHGIPVYVLLRRRSYGDSNRPPSWLLKGPAHRNWTEFTGTDALAAAKAAAAD